VVELGRPVKAGVWHVSQVVPDGSGICTARLIDTTPAYCPEWHVAHAAVVLAWLKEAPKKEAKPVWHVPQDVPAVNGTWVDVLMETTPTNCPLWQVEQAAVVVEWSYTVPANVVKLL
jgi:hypothetical protein